MRADAARNRKRVFDVAERLFTQKGLAVEIDEIAEAAGVGVGTIYRHFATKDALVRAVFAIPIEDLIERAKSLAGAPDPGAAFFTFFDELVALATAKHRLVDALSKSGEAVIGTPAEIASRHARFRAAFEVLLTRAQRAGTVRRDVGAPEIVALVNGAFPYLQRSGGTREEHVRLLRFIVDGLAAGVRSPPRVRRRRAE